jgi:NADPH2:quinone reductase
MIADAAGSVRPPARVVGTPRASTSKLGYEAAGEIAALGQGVTGFAVGDAVSTIPSFSMNHYGMYGDAAIVPAHAVVKHPANLSWAEAAAIWMQYLTAYGALVELVALRRARRL